MAIARRWLPRPPPARGWRLPSVRLQDIASGFRFLRCGLDAVAEQPVAALEEPDRAKDHEQDDRNNRNRLEALLRRMGKNALQIRPRLEGREGRFAACCLKLRLVVDLSD